MSSPLNSISKTTVTIAFSAFSVLFFPVLGVPVHASGLKISPTLECVIRRDLDNDSIVDTYTAVWGYNNLNAETVTIAAGGSDNRYSPTPAFRGQPSDFNPGRAYGLFDNNFTSGNVVWTLKGPDGQTRTATASTNSAQCSAGTTLAHPYDETHTYI